jgi:hypothetical protein
MYEFKVLDYSTVMVGRRYRDTDGHGSWIYYVERGDGTRWEYEEYRVEWSEQLFNINGKREPLNDRMAGILENYKALFEHGEKAVRDEVMEALNE